MRRVGILVSLVLLVSLTLPAATLAKSGGGRGPGGGTAAPVTVSCQRYIDDVDADGNPIYAYEWWATMSVDVTNQYWNAYFGPWDENVHLWARSSAKTSAPAVYLPYVEYIATVEYGNFLMGYAGYTDWELPYLTVDVGYFGDGPSGPGWYSIAMGTGKCQPPAAGPNLPE